jgi:hypothetical protein
MALRRCAACRARGGRYRPHEPDEFASHGRYGYLRLLAAPEQRSITATEPDLRLPGNVLCFLRYVCRHVLAHVRADLRPLPVAPGRLIQQSSDRRVAALGDSTSSDFRSARVLAWIQAEERHELLGVLESSDVTDLGDDSHRDDEPDSSQARLGESGDANLLAQLNACLDELDPTLLAPPAYEQTQPQPRRGRRGR